MIYCFDTSAINALNDDAECDVIVKGLIATNTIYITAFNVAEVLSTEDHVRRKSLLQLEKELTRGADPIVLPHELLKKQGYAHAQRMRRLGFPIFTEDQLILRGYRYFSPEDEQVRQVMLSWKENLNQSFNYLFKNSRPDFQSLFSGGTIERPKSLAKLIRYYGRNDDLLYEYVSSMYQDASGVELDRHGFRRVLTDIPEILLLLFSFVPAIYERAIQEHGYSPKNKPGPVDLWSAIYLPHCDYFITSDRRQQKALRTINVFNRHTTKILSYKTFRSRLLLN